jgi:H+-transporting ATPase
MAIGASTMAEKKAIVTHLTALQEIASMKVLCSDKTGTLTTANMTIIADKIWCNEGFTADEVLTWAAIASNPNNKEDPIDQAVFRGFENHFGTERAAGIVGQYKIHQFMGFNPIIKRTVVKATVSSSSGGGGTKKPLVITKGLLNKVLDTRHGLDAQQLSSGETDGGELQWSVEGLAQIGPMVKDVDVQLAVKGYKTIAVAVRRPPTLDDPNGGPMVLAGIVPMLDPPRKDTAQTVYRIRDAQVDVKMITGDHLNIAKETSKLIHLGTNVLPSTALWPASATRDKLILDADGFAQVLPKDKKEVVMVLQNMGMVVGMTGDGVNDAPALAQAQIGIAVDGATEAAKAAADIILTTPGLSAIFDAVVESRRIFQRLQAYILYRMAATFQIVMVLTLLICIYDKMINPLYVILLALFNDVTMAPISSDNALPSKKPDVPTVKYIVGMSLLFGGLSTIQTMVYYHYVDVWDHPDEKGGEPLDYSAKDDDIKVGLVWLAGFVGLVFVGATDHH